MNPTPKSAPAPLNIEDAYRRYGPMVLRRCRALLRNEDDAVDAMQTTFVRVVQAGARLDGQAPSSLLYQMATRVCLNALRTRRRRPEVPATDEEALLERIASAGDLGARFAAFRVLDRLFRDELDGTRALAVLHLHDGLTLAEVALVSGLSVSGVRKRLARLRASLHELERLS